MTLRQGRRFGFWNAMPAILTGPLTLAPEMTMLPVSGGISPVTSFINDDLPQPDGPTTAANSPRRTLSDVPFSARTPPDAPRYVSVTSSISTEALMPGLSSTPGD